MIDLNKLGIIADKDTINLDQIIKQVRSETQFRNAGDFIIFSGIVRESSSVSSKKVQQIEIQAYKEMAEKQLNQICVELIEKYNLVDARVVHYTGLFNVGDFLVHCIIASKHRKEGFKAITELIEAYKHRAYIFKCEIYDDGTSEWISTDQVEKIHQK
ncbi:MAG: molybdenum cofactor biosynthesis protein MoaE [Candidatus Hodarchaeota archaeon]